MVEVKETKQDLLITRVYEAPRQLVWKAWTECEHFKRWWGPKDFTIPYCRIDLRPGGTYLYSMRSPEGQDYWSTGVYHELVEPELIVCTDSFSDENGNVVPATYYGMGAEYPLEMLVRVTFNEEQGETTMILRHSGLPPGADRDNTRLGWNESFDKLADYLED